ncbi:ABC transporter substrate-binding protein [Oryzibacter oryziterrae]|uniref:ABC transporter substrate-binding protein n=1 Tax=Oryzibacter oryziterrae TaxID=2766474 RepID=UPI0036F1A3EE
MRKSLAILMAGMALSFAATPGRADDLTIAVVGPMTGPLASIGDWQKHGGEAAAALLNDAGGVNGVKVKIVVEDDACDPKQAVAVANRLVADGVKFVAGHACSGSSIPAAAVYADNNVLMMTPASSNPALTEKGYPTVMRLYGRDDAQGAFVAPWIARHYAGKNVAILHDKSAYGQGLAEVVKASVNAAGLTEVLYEGINPGEKDYSSLIGKLQSLKVDAVYFGGYHTEGGLIKRQAADRNYAPDLIMADSLSTAEYWAITGAAGEGSYFTFPTSPVNLPSAQAAVAKFKAENYSPDGFTLFSYAVVQAIAEGVKRAGSDDPSAVAEALKNGTPVDTVVGSIVFDEKGDIKDPKFEINLWHDGKYAPIDINK